MNHNKQETTIDQSQQTQEYKMSTNDSNSAEQRSLQRQLMIESTIAKMTNVEIADMLYKYIRNDKTNEFKQCLKAIKLLKNEIDLHYILNEELCGEFERPLIMEAVSKNNIEIVETLLRKENDYKV